MINYTCTCGSRYYHAAEITQNGGALLFTDFGGLTGIEPRGAIVFVCRCGEEIPERALWATIEEEKR